MSLCVSGSVAVYAAAGTTNATLHAFNVIAMSAGSDDERASAETGFAGSAGWEASTCSSMDKTNQ